MTYLNSDSEHSNLSKPFEDSKQGIVVELPLKFSFKHCADANIDLSTENKLAFDIVDTFSQNENNSERKLERQVDRAAQTEQAAHTRVLEKKLNIVMQLLNSLLANVHGDSLEKYLVKLSANTIEWDLSQFHSDSHPILELNQNVIFDLYPTSDLPYPVKRSGVIVDISGSVISAKFNPLDRVNQERFEKWIFQLHRRLIHSKAV